MSLTFADSPRSTVGIEWELQLVDTDSNDLRQVADTVIERAQDDAQLAPFLHREMLLNTVEVVSEAHTRVADCVTDLRAAFKRLRSITDPLRVDLAAGGSHPFADPLYQRVTDSRRYAELVGRTAYWGRQMLLYGVHVHVGVEAQDKVLPLINALLTKAGQLQAVAASSPFWVGKDTGYASNRQMVFQQLPTAGLPRQFSTWGQLERYADDMLKTGAISVFNELRWDVRPALHLGTIELRIFDSCTNVFEVEAMAALAHCLVEHYSRQLDAGERLEQLPEWFVAENKWRAARYGLNAELIVDRKGRIEPVRNTLLQLVEVLQPVARDLDCIAGLDKVRHILQVGAAYERERAVSQLADEEPEFALNNVVELMRAEMVADRPLSVEEFLAMRGKPRVDSAVCRG